MAHHRTSRAPWYVPAPIPAREEMSPLTFAVGPKVTCRLCKKQKVETHRVAGKTGWFINTHQTPTAKGTKIARTCNGPKEAVC